VNNESQNKHQSRLQPATRSARTPVTKKGLHQRAGEVLSLARPLSYRAAQEFAGDFFHRDDYFRRFLSPVGVEAK
jgi:hypothetical protein